jgi:hypothetical protein
MTTHHSRSVLTAGILACAVIGFSPRPSLAQAVGNGDDKLQVTAVGCLQTERDYRQQHSKANGGALRTGLGEGNEYMLVNATIGVQSMEVPPAPESDVNNCAASPETGQAFELSGKGEGDLAQYVGRRVVIRGTLKHAEHDPDAVGTSGTFTPRPTNGGVDLTGGELQLREINVDSLAVAPIAAATREEAAAAAPAPAAPVPQPAGEPPAAPELPKTASPLPAIGLIGLLSLAAALGLRLARVRAS